LLETGGGAIRRRTAAAVTAALLAGGAGGCDGWLGGPGPEPVVIGADLALTGTGSELGLVHHNALQLRVAQLNQPGLLGDRRLVLRVRDNRSDPQVAASNLAELAADPAVTAIVSGACGRCVTAAAGQLDAHRVPTISLAADDQVATPVAERRHLFKLGPNAGDDAAVLAGELVRDRVATVGLVTVADAYGDAAGREMADVAGRGGFEIVVHQRVGVDDAGSVTAAAEAIAGWSPDPPPGLPPGSPPGLPPGSPPGLPPAPPGAPPAPPGSRTDPLAGPGPDAVVIWAPAPQASQLASDLREAGYRGDLHLDAIAAGDLYQPGDALTGATVVFTHTPVADQLIATTPAKAARQTWFRDYLARYGTYHAQASWAADAVGVIAEAIRRADLAGQPVDRDTIRDKIESTRRLDGLTGLIRYTADQHSGLHPESLTILVAGGGRWRLAR
jgi:branched-chain amino acid transport system substrate-binding protein